jgi:glucose-1-phosphate adenylyltransferase
MKRSILAVILGGGRGTRLQPLTQVRSKPAVPIGGKYRLIDIPISNCLHSGIDTIYILTQFNSASLNRHIHRTYRFDVFERGFIEILAAEQTIDNPNWFQGTADAVRHTLRYFDSAQWDLILILSGDHLYRMDYQDFVNSHIDSGNDVTVSVKGVNRNAATEFGILRTNPDGQITNFVEKPSDNDELSSLEQPDAPEDQAFLASMGIYLFRREVLNELLSKGSEEDFGREIIPRAIREYRVGAHRFEGYWRDIGTIKAFYEANLALAWDLPMFNFYEPGKPIFTRPRFLPSSKINDCRVRNSILSDGSIILDATIEESIVGIRSIVRKGVTIRRSIIMGADFYEDEPERDDRRGHGELGIGADCVIENAIIDKNVHVGAGSRIVNTRGVQNEETPMYTISDGIIVVPKDTIIPPGTVI